MNRDLPRDDLKPVKVTVASQRNAMHAQAQCLTPVVYNGTAPVGSLSAGTVSMAGGHVARAHVHLHSEIIIIVLAGNATTLWGSEMAPIPHGPGTMLWVPPGCPHTAVNLNDADEIVAVEVRTDPAFNDDVELLPELDPIAAARVEELRRNQDVLPGTPLAATATWLGSPV